MLWMVRDIVCTHKRRRSELAVPIFEVESAKLDKTLPAEMYLSVCVEGVSKCDDPKAPRWNLKVLTPGSETSLRLIFHAAPQETLGPYPFLGTPNHNAGVISYHTAASARTTRNP
jgi:hypothetical protein